MAQGVAIAQGNEHTQITRKRTMGQPDGKRTKQTSTKRGQVEDQVSDLQGDRAGNGESVGRGGARSGAGRPKATATAVLRIRLPIAVHTKVIDKGGDVWVKRLINEALKNSLPGHKNDA